MKDPEPEMILQAQRRVLLLEALELLADESKAGLAPMPWLDKRIWQHCYQGA